MRLEDRLRHDLGSVEPPTPPAPPVRQSPTLARRWTVRRRLGLTLAGVGLITAGAVALGVDRGGELDPGIDRTEAVTSPTDEGPAVPDGGRTALLYHDAAGIHTWTDGAVTTLLDVRGVGVSFSDGGGGAVFQTGLDRILRVTAEGAVTEVVTAGPRGEQRVHLRGTFLRQGVPHVAYDLTPGPGPVVPGREQLPGVSYWTSLGDASTIGIAERRFVQGGSTVSGGDLIVTTACLEPCVLEFRGADGRPIAVPGAPTLPAIASTGQLFDSVAVSDDGERLWYLDGGDPEVDGTTDVVQHDLDGGHELLRVRVPGAWRVVRLDGDRVIVLRRPLGDAATGWVSPVEVAADGRVRERPDLPLADLTAAR